MNEPLELFRMGPSDHTCMRLDGTWRCVTCSRFMGDPNDSLRARIERAMKGNVRL